MSHFLYILNAQIQWKPLCREKTLKHWVRDWESNNHPKTESRMERLIWRYNLVDILYPGFSGLAQNDANSYFFILWLIRYIQRYYAFLGDREIFEAHDCRFCSREKFQDMIIREGKNWILLYNKYPYTGIDEQYHSAIPHAHKEFFTEFTERKSRAQTSPWRSERILLR